MKPIRSILAGLYRMGLKIRHWCYDVGLKREFTPDITVICVGNLTVGGTGKTPMVEFLVERLGRQEVVAVLSRGYGRRTKGYIEVTMSASFRDVGDEPKQIKHKFPGVVVVVCEERVEGFKRLRREHPEVTMVIMDDGFQHRAIKPTVNIILMDYTRPIYEDRMLPRGTLRDLPSQIKRAGIVAVTKVPPETKPIDIRIVAKLLALRPFQSLYFTTMIECEPRAQFPSDALPLGRDVVLLTGVGNPKAVEADVCRRFRVMKHIVYRDHYVYTLRDMRSVATQMSALAPDTSILTTEKDAVKMTSAKNPLSVRQRLYVLPVRLGFIAGGNGDEFIKKLYEYVAENKKLGRFSK